MFFFPFCFQCSSWAWAGDAESWWADHAAEPAWWQAQEAPLMYGVFSFCFTVWYLGLSWWCWVLMSSSRSWACQAANPRSRMWSSPCVFCWAPTSALTSSPWKPLTMLASPCSSPTTGESVCRLYYTLVMVSQSLVLLHGPACVSRRAYSVDMTIQSLALLRNTSGVLGFSAQNKWWDSHWRHCSQLQALLLSTLCTVGESFTGIIVKQRTV